MEKVIKSEEEWKKILTPEEYRVMREKGTEPAFTGEYWDLDEKGRYLCRACGNELFSSDAKFDSGTGWPSFYAPVKKDSVETAKDKSYGPPSPDGFGWASMDRAEAVCGRCGGHLGHVFPDGPKPTGQRYCINSTSLKFEEGERSQQ